MSIAGKSDPDFNFVYPIRTPLTVLPADNFTIPADEQVIITNENRIKENKPTIGFRVTEKIGVGVINVRAVTKVTLIREMGGNNDGNNQ